MDVLVVTNPEHGWDCVIGVFTDIEQIKKFFQINNDFDNLRDFQEFLNIRQQANYVIHERNLIGSEDFAIFTNRSLPDHDCHSHFKQN
jgi:hypothetical protein